MYALLFIAAAAGKDIFFSEKKLHAIPAMVRVGFMVSMAMAIVCPLIWMFFGIREFHALFGIWIFIHPALLGMALIQQMRALSMGPISKTQPLMVLGLVLLVVFDSLFAQRSVGAGTLLAAMMAFVGMVITSLSDGKMAKTTESEAWQVNGEFDISIFQTKVTSSRIPVDVSPKLESFTKKLRTGGYFHSIGEMWRERWHKSAVFNSITAALLASLAMYFEILCTQEGTPHTTFVFFDLIVMAWYLCLFVGISGIGEKMATAKAIRAKSKKQSQSKELSLFRQLWLGGVLFAASILFLEFSFSSDVFSLMPIVMSLPLMGVSAWGYFVRKERRVTPMRIFGHVAVFVGSIVILYHYTTLGT